jgi:hypothetical protein
MILVDVLVEAPLLQRQPVHIDALLSQLFVLSLQLNQHCKHQCCQTDNLQPLLAPLAPQPPVPAGP